MKRNTQRFALAGKCAAAIAAVRVSRSISAIPAKPNAPFQRSWRRLVDIDKLVHIEDNSHELFQRVEPCVLTCGTRLFPFKERQHLARLRGFRHAGEGEAIG